MLLRVGLEIHPPRTKIRWYQVLCEEPVRISQACKIRERERERTPLSPHSQLIRFPLSCSCLFKKFVRGPDCREQARAGHAILEGTPHPPTPILPSSAWRLGRKGRSAFA